MKTAYNAGSKSVLDWIKHHHSDYAAGDIESTLKEGNPSAAAFMKMQAFTTAAVQDQRIRTRIQAALAGNLKRGEDQADFKKVIDAEFEKAGLTKLHPSAIQNIYYTNTSLAFGAGQREKLTEVAVDFPYWKYSATMDSKTRPSHAALHGKIFKTGDYNYFPPIGFRCRCTAIPLTARQAAAQGGESKHPEGDYGAMLENKEFIGNKEVKYMKWLAKEYDKGDKETKAHIDKAIDELKAELKEAKDQSADYYNDVIAAEEKIRRNKSFETAVIFDKNGKEIFRKKGKKTSVGWSLEELSNFKDTIFTHNHPRGWSYNEADLRRIGNSFSLGDVRVAIKANVAEMRAVTPHYTFIMRRPKGGWKISPETAEREFKKIDSELTAEGIKQIYAAKGSHISKRAERAEALHYHLVWKRFCKKFGIEYTKVKS